MKPKDALKLDQKKLNTPLTVEIASGQLQIRIGLKTLKIAAEQGEAFNPFDDKKNDFVRAFKITNLVEFGTGVVRFLQDEAEDGSTVITRALDDGVVYAIESDYGVDQTK